MKIISIFFISTCIATLLFANNINSNIYLSEQTFTPTSPNKCFDNKCLYQNSIDTTKKLVKLSDLNIDTHGSNHNFYAGISKKLTFS